jgi:hypothetical protein
MKLFRKVIPALFLISFFNPGWSVSDPESALATTCEVDLGSDAIINFWEEYQINAAINYPSNEVEEMIWSHAENLSCTDCLNPVVTTAEDICISLTVHFSDGCIASDEICIFVIGCHSTNYENKIHSITPTNITETAVIELEIARSQFTQIEIVQNDEVLYSIFEGWAGSGLKTRTLDFSDVPAGEYSLRVKLYPENKYITITKL